MSHIYRWQYMEEAPVVGRPLLPVERAARVVTGTCHDGREVMFTVDPETGEVTIDERATADHSLVWEPVTVTSDSAVIRRG